MPASYPLLEDVTVAAARTLRASTTPTDGSGSGQATADSLHQQLDALRARQAELQNENRQLREALARNLGAQRADPPSPL